MFRNCGGSAKRNTTIGWSMLLSWCIGFFPPLEKKLIESLRKLCEEPDCMFSESCVVWTATWVMIPINVVSSPLPSSLLYFLFVTSFLQRFSLCHFPMSIFHKIENTFEKMITQYLLFVVKKNFVCAHYCWNLSSLDSFVDFSKKTNFFSPFFCQNVAKINSCV